MGKEGQIFFLFKRTIMNGNEGMDHTNNIPTASDDMLKASDTGEFNIITNGAALSSKKNHKLRIRSKSECVPTQSVSSEGTAFVAKSKNDRKPKNLKGSGKAKKDGAGGKGTWGKNGEIYEENEEGRDPSDPNFDAELSNDVVMSLIQPDLTSPEFDVAVTPIIKEYYDHCMTSEVSTSLSELNITHIKHRIVYLTVSIALEHKNMHRELTSKLISDVYGDKIINKQEIEFGFQALLNALPELILDTPEAPEILGMFMARCIADDCLNPSFLKEQMVHATDMQLEALSKAQHYLQMKHGLVRLDNVWGYGGGIKPVKILVKKMVLLIKEYLSSFDIREAEKCVTDLNVPHFHHEIIFEAIQMGLEDGNDHVMNGVIDLMKRLYDSGMITDEQVTQGFTRIYDNMEDFVLDIPYAYRNLGVLVNKCCRVGLISVNLRQKAPDSGRRKRFMSEGDFSISRPLEVNISL